MKRRRLYLMRHAEVAYFGADGLPFDPTSVPLTPNGSEQARKAGEALADVELRSGDHERARADGGDGADRRAWP